MMSPRSCLCCVAFAVAMSMLVGCSRPASGYHVSAEAVTYESNSAGHGRGAIYTKRILDADPDSFRVIRQSYAVDNATVWYCGKVLTGADAKTFADAMSAKFDCRDGRFFYSHGNAVATTDPTFQYYRDVSFGYAVDSDAVYLRESQIFSSLVEVKGADPDTFEPIDAGDPFLHWGRDAEQVFTGTLPVQGANPETFRIIPTPRVLDGESERVHFPRRFVRSDNLAAHFGDQYSLVEIPPGGHIVCEGVGTDNASFFDAALRVDEKPDVRNAKVFERLNK